MDYILLFIWFIMLIKWADILVDWSSSLARKYWISSLVIWLTIVAFWTSSPEFVISFISAYSGNTDISISNVVWSNISNILLILWVTSIFYPILMPNSTVKKEIPFLIFITILFYFLLSDNFISRLDSLILLLFFVLFIIYTFKIAKQIGNDDNKIITYTSTKSIIYIILWLVWLIFWWKIIVSSAISIAEWFWIPNSFIWVTIIAIWTSLPEMAASIMAAIKKNTDMAIWWVVWSNLFNILWIVWWTGIIYPLNWYSWLNTDLLINILSVILLLIFAYTIRKSIITRLEWFILFLIYVIYIIFLLNNL